MNTTYPVSSTEIIEDEMQYEYEQVEETIDSYVDALAYDHTNYNINSQE